MAYDCTISDSAPPTVGVNTLLASAEAAPVPEVMALAAFGSPFLHRYG